MAKRRSRYFLFGVLVTSLVWCAILLRLQYVQVEDTGIRVENRRLRLKSKFLNSFQQFSNPADTPRPVSQVTESDTRNENANIDKWEEEVGQVNPKDEDNINRQDAFLRRGPTLSPQELEMRRMKVAGQEDDQRLVQTGYQQNAFNQVVSDRIGHRRDVPDTRHALCQSLTYGSDLPKASIIICFYNEAPSTLLRTVQSVLDRTPAHLLREVLLVDDHSNREHLLPEIKKFLKQELKVRYVRGRERQGLMRERNLGAKMATGDVIVFLDSHCEVNQGWLEPLLARIKEDPSCVVCPVIDIINEDTFTYYESPIVKGGFNWGMNFNWEQLSPHELDSPKKKIQAIRSPTMAGGLFAATKDFFFSMGAYDEGMESWGSENLEMSFRVWMCGGSLEILPCSRVGHVFRKFRPYDEPGDAWKILKNQLRLVDVWLDEYKKFYYQIHPDHRNVDFGNVTARKELRERLKCKSFDWYMRNVFPSMIIPGDPVGEKRQEPFVIQGLVSRDRVVKIGQIFNDLTDSCLDIAGRMSVKMAEVELQPCEQKDDQTWVYTGKQEIKLGKLCLSGKHSKLLMMKCLSTSEGQIWEVLQNGLYHPASNSCLEASGLTKTSSLVACVDGKKEQKFTWLDK